MRLNQLLTAALLAANVTVAFAGAVSSTAGIVKTGSIQIDADGNGSTDYNLDISSLLSVNASTGALSLSLPTAPIGDAFGQWNTGTYLLGTNSYTGLSWHSWQTVSGNIDNNGSALPTNSQDPWASSFVLRLGGNVDPEMNYGFSVKNNGTAVQAYTITFGESLVPTVSGDYTVQADLAGAVSSVASSQGVSVAPNTGSGLMQELYLRRVSDGSFVNAGVNVGTAFSTGALGSVNYPQQSSALVNGNSGADSYDYWEFRTKFTLTGGKDTFVANGAAVLTAVPEPESYALAVAALLMLWSLSSRRLRR